MTTIIRLLTSRLAGPIAAGVAVLLALALAVAQVHLAGARGDLKDARARIETLSRDLGTCRANTAALSSSLKRQNAAVTAQGKADAQRLAQAGKDLTTALRGRERAEAQAAKLMRAGPVGVDACARAIDAFETVKEGVR